MLDPTVKSAFVVLVAWLLKLVCDRFGIPLNDAVLTALAVAIVAWIMGEAAGARVAARIRNFVSNFVSKVKG